MPISKQLELKIEFASESVKALGTTRHVLRFFGYEPGQLDLLGFSDFVNAMQALCVSHQRDAGGIEDLRITISVVNSYCEAVRLHKALADDEFRRGLASTQRYMSWLRQTFQLTGPNRSRIDEEAV